MILVAAPLNDEQKDRFREAAEGEEIVFTTVEGALTEDIERAEIIVGNIDPGRLKGLKKLRFLQLYSAGYDKYATGILEDDCILACATGAYGLTVSEYSIAALMAFNRNLHIYVRNQMQNAWIREGKVHSIEGSVILILGAGDIGLDVARKVKAMGAYTIGTKRSTGNKPECLDELHTLDELDSLLPRADAVIIALPALPETYHLINSRTLGLMNPDAVIVNVGRGNIINCMDLYEALKNRTIRGACLDVTEPEPLPADHPLWSLDNIIITPHAAGGFALGETLNRITAIACENIRHFHAGETVRNLIRH